MDPARCIQLSVDKWDGYVTGGEYSKRVWAGSGAHVLRDLDLDQTLRRYHGDDHCYKMAYPPGLLLTPTLTALDDQLMSSEQGKAPLTEEELAVRLSYFSRQCWHQRHLYSHQNAALRQRIADQDAQLRDAHDRLRDAHSRLQEVTGYLSQMFAQLQDVMAARIAAELKLAGYGVFEPEPLTGFTSTVSHYSNFSRHTSFMRLTCPIYLKQPDTSIGTQKRVDGSTPPPGFVRCTDSFFFF